MMMMMMMMMSDDNDERQHDIWSEMAGFALPLCRHLPNTAKHTRRL